MKILVTGFGPFDVFSFNPSEKIAERLSGESPDTTFMVLPVEYGKAREELLEVLFDLEPDLLLSFGLNGTIGHIALEEIALNIRASEVPDNSGEIMSDRKISLDGPLAYRTLLPTERILKELREKGIPAKHSYSAGVYICNEVFYTGVEWAQKSRRKAGFIHVPMATEMIAGDPRNYRIPHMSMKLLIDAGRTILKTVTSDPI
ncbi:MAG: pyroglutamyl-peptidase I [Candidatus Thermoplasmatota archaeon]|nr:pyroglutamyl-peptidase I [Candidatus Thermoplasmatota archaeon]